MKPSSIIVVENGASSIKAGTVGGGLEPRIIPNAVVRSKGDKMTYFGHEVDRCRDYSSLHYRLPFEKGYLVDWDAQKAVWDGIFSSEVIGLNPSECSLLITEPYFNLPNIQDVYDQFVFEEYEFQSYYRCTPAAMIPYGTLFAQPDLPPAESMLIVDSGFSFTHIVPILSGKVIWNAVKRLDVGGKLLTNQLKELVSFRQWNMMDETYIMNHVKETCCYVSTQFGKDIDICRQDPKSNPIVQEYILPDFSANRQGRIRRPEDIIAETDQILFMNNERFAVPEILFRPDDIGLQQSGLSATIAASIALLPDDLQGMFWANIGLTGGTTKFPGFYERLMQELRPLAPVECEVVIYQCDDPITEAYRSASIFAGQPLFMELSVTKAEYMEGGSNACRRKFKDWRASDEGAKEESSLKGKGKGKQRDESGRPDAGAKTRKTSTGTRRR